MTTTVRAVPQDYEPSHEGDGEDDQPVNVSPYDNDNRTAKDGTTGWFPVGAFFFLSADAAAGASGDSVVLELRKTLNSPVTTADDAVAVGADSSVEVCSARDVKGFSWARFLLDTADGETSRLYIHLE